MADLPPSLAAAVEALGTVTLLRDRAALPEGQRAVPLDRDGLLLAAPAASPPGLLLAAKQQLQRHLDLAAREQALTQLSQLLGHGLVELLQSLGERSLDETRIASMFGFLGADTRYAVRREGLVLFNNGLDEHTLHIGQRRAEARRVHSVAVDHGELFTCAVEDYQGCFLRGHTFTAVERALVELHLALLARHTRQQTLYRALANINELFAREFLAGSGHTPLDATDASTVERNFTTLLDAALKDSLTQAYNRNKTGELLAGLCQRGTAFTLLLLDVDHFKRVNDEHGHPVGDRVLVELARRLQASLRTSDVLARWGGEEFMIICRSAPAGDAVALAERLRESVAASPVDGTLSITASLGLTHARPGEPPETVIARADAALYASKRGGRNRVTVL